VARENLIDLPSGVIHDQLAEHVPEIRRYRQISFLE